MRIVCGIEYDGTGFCGWQTQRGVRTVQETVEAAISKVANHPVRIVCAGRTDAGVHASAQVIHFDSGARRSMRSWVLGSNVNLSHDVAVQWATPVSADFHARYSATARHYRYRILDRWVRSPLHHCRATWCHKPLQVEPMAAAATYLVGEHDFSAFRAQACQAKSPVRTIRRLDVVRSGETITIDVVANGFLQHMVRNIAGVLMAIGAGEHQPRWVREVLEQRDRRLGGVTAPAAGLYLVGVEYPERFGLPASVTSNRK